MPVILFMLQFLAYLSAVWLLANCTCHWGCSSYGLSLARGCMSHCPLTIPWNTSACNVISTWKSLNCQKKKYIYISLHQHSGCFISAHKRWKPSFLPWSQMSPPEWNAIHSISLYHIDSGKYHLLYKITLFYGEKIVSEFVYLLCL